MGSESIAHEAEVTSCSESPFFPGMEKLELTFASFFVSNLTFAQY